jgi:Cu(I)/Ag(I) efflux system membrane fusion protein
VLTAPADGVVAELGVREGVAVTPGMTLFRIAGLEKVWAVAEIPEAQAVRLARARRSRQLLQADAAQSFDGELEEILPEVSAATRTLKARFEVDNKGGKLTPGMLLRLQVTGAEQHPAGRARGSRHSHRQARVVIVRKADGAFEPRTCRWARTWATTSKSSQGLAEGDQVVASGQFLIDSEARLRSVLGSMAASAAGLQWLRPRAPPHRARGPQGRRQGRERGADGITISHGPVATLKWPP